MKSYEYIIPKYFPSNHPRAGELLGVGNKLTDTTDPTSYLVTYNYPTWVLRVANITKGGYSLTVKEMDGKSIGSKRVTIGSFTNISIFPLEFRDGGIYINGVLDNDISLLALRCGLSVRDFKEWHKNAPRQTLGLIKLNSKEQHNQPLSVPFLHLSSKLHPKRKP